MTNTITVSGINILIDRKDIKNLHLAVYPPDGVVRVAVPNHITDDNVRLAIITKLSWIKKQQASFKEQDRQSKREIVSGESHYYFGRRYKIQIIANKDNQGIKIYSNKLWLTIKPETSQKKKDELLNQWYRDKLKKRIPILIEKWEKIIGVKVNSWSIRKMKTKWGSCKNSSGHIIFNSELVKKPPDCLEYIVVHEMVHLLERHHNNRFKVYMDNFIPKWQLIRERLNKSPLSHEDWRY